MGASAVSTDDSGISTNTADVYPEADLERLQSAVRVLLSGVGEDITREGLRDTPKRVAKAWVDVSLGYRQDLHSVLGGALFHEPMVAEGSGSMVIVRDIEFASTSESDLLPFYGRCHVAYMPKNGVVLGLSKLARVTKLYAQQLQSQQRLTSQILVALQQDLAPLGAAIVMEARHLAHGPEADFFMTSASSGCFQDVNGSCMQEFLCMLRLHGIPVPSTALPKTPRNSQNLFTLPSPAPTPARIDADSIPFMSSMGSKRIYARNGGSGTVASVHQFGLEDTATMMDADCVEQSQASVSDMQQAVEVILQEIGEDLERPELQGAAQRYVQMLLASTAGSRHHPALLSQHCPLRAEPSSIPHIQEWHVQFSSQCEHHMLPFHGTAHIAVVHTSGSSSLSHQQIVTLVEQYSHRLQIQERLTNQLADAVQALTGAVGSLAMCEAAHMCMVARGVEKHSSSTITLATRGVVTQDAALRSKLLLQLSSRQRR